MASLTRSDGHLIVAAVRVLTHTLQRSPEPEEIAALLALPAAAVRVQIVALTDLGILAMVASAFATHVEVRDYVALEELPATDESELAEELADFDRRKQAETAKMSQLFADGEHERRRADKLDKMNKDLRAFRERKPPNPFDDE
jgi:hypothetical protein